MRHIFMGTIALGSLLCSVDPPRGDNEKLRDFRKDVGEICKDLNNDKDPAKILATMDKLARMSEVLRSEARIHMCSLFSHSDPKVRAQAARTFGEIGSAEAAMGVQLIRALDDESAEVRAAATQGLMRIRGSAIVWPAVPKLIKLLREDKSTEVRMNAAWALAALGQEAKEAVPALIDAIKDEATVPNRGMVAFPAIHALGVIKDERAVPPLLSVLKENRHSELRSLACLQLGRFAASRRDVVPAIVEVLEDPKCDNGLRVNAAYSLGEIGTPAIGAIPALKKLIDVENETLRKSVRDALKKLEP